MTGRLYTFAATAAAALACVVTPASADVKRFSSAVKLAPDLWSFQVRDVPVRRVTGAQVRAGRVTRMLDRRTARALLRQRGRPVRVRVPGVRRARRAVLEISLAPVNTARPSLEGVPVVGQTLTCHVGAWVNGPHLQVQWLRGFRPVAGQTGTRYTLTDADVGEAVACRVTGHGGAVQVPALSPPMTVRPNDQPYLLVSGNTVSWLPVNGAQVYRYAMFVDGDREHGTYGKITGTSFTLPVLPGHTVTFGLRADVDGGKWAEEVELRY